MIIYEVNLKINNDIYDNFHIWLQDHIEKVLSSAGFLDSKVYNVETDIINYKLLSVHYYVKDIDSLNSYFMHHAPKLREEGLTLFLDGFSAKRRILSTLD